MSITKEKQYVSVFIGSTYEDLKEYRNEVQNVLVRLETIVKGMEYFGATPNTPLEECLQKVRESKIYIGIFAARYGSIDEISGKSFTQLEYEEADKLGLPILIYFLDEENQPILSKFVDKGEKAKKLDDFKKFLEKRYVIDRFTTPADLGRRVSNDLSKVLESVTNIKVDKLTDLDINDGYNVYMKFLKRPKKYMHHEVYLKINIKEDYVSLSNRFSKAFNFEEGTAIFISGNSLYDNENQITNRSFTLYATGIIADWIEENDPCGDYRAKVRFMYGSVPEIIDTNEGKIIVKTDFTGLMLLEIPQPL